MRSTDFKILPVLTSPNQPNGTMSPSHTRTTSQGINSSASDVRLWLGSRWYSFDARHNQRRIGRIAIATGRDAVDVPITMVFGRHRLERFTVVTEELRSNEKVNPRMSRFRSSGTDSVN